MSDKASIDYLEEWIELYNKGISMREIARKYGFSASTVRIRLGPYINIREKSPNLKYSDEWLKLYNDGYTKSEIALKYDVNRNVVGKVLKKCGINTSGKRKKFTHLENDFKEKYLEGYSLNEIADMYNTSKQTVLNYLNDLNVEIRDYSQAIRKIKLYEDYFEDLNPHKLFTLGIIFAYGWINNFNNLSKSFCFSSKRKEFTDFIVKELYYPEDYDKVTIYTSYDIYKVEIYSLKLVESLRKYNLYSKKESIFPDFNKQDMEIFLNGFLYSISYFNSKEYRTKCTKNEYIKVLKEFIIEYIMIDESGISTYSNVDSYLSIHRKTDIEKMKKYLAKLEKTYMK